MSNMTSHDTHLKWFAGGAWTFLIRLCCVQVQLVFNAPLIPVFHSFDISHLAFWTVPTCHGLASLKGPFWKWWGSAKKHCPFICREVDRRIDTTLMFGWYWHRQVSSNSLQGNEFPKMRSSFAPSQHLKKPVPYVLVSVYGWVQVRLQAPLTSTVLQ